MKEMKENLSAAENKRRAVNRNALLSVLFATILIIAFFLGYFVRGYSEPAYARKISEIIKLINSMSVYPSEQSADDLARKLLKDVLKDDKYAYYYTAEEYKKILEEDKGNYSGIGAAFSQDGKIAKVYLNSPAYNNGEGLKLGDKLLAGKYKGDEEYTDFQEKLNTENFAVHDYAKKTILDVYTEFFSEFELNEVFKVKVERDGEPLEFELSKQNYVVSYVEYFDDEKYYYFSTDEDGFSGRQSDEKFISGLSGDTAYIKLYEFEGGAAVQFAEALSFMRERGKSKLILDLRDNGGGLINVLLDIASYLITDENGSSGLKVVKVKEKDATTHYSTSSNRFSGDITDISVIANKNTASAAESLIGALNDYGDKDLFGGAAFSLDRLILTEADENGVYRTFGKGIMQTTIRLNTGGALKLTTAYIYWPLSNPEICVQDTGIETTDEFNRVSDEDAISRADEVLHAE